MTLPPVILRFLEAARRADAVTLNELVDWPASGANRLVSALHEIDPSRRDEAARAGLRELGILPGGNQPPYPLGSLALRLAANPEAQPADPDEERRALAQLRVGPPPAGLSPEVEEALTALAKRTAEIEDVFVVRFHDTDRTALGMLPGGERVALVRDS